MEAAALIDGILDTSVLIDPSPDSIAPREGMFAISVLTLAELHKGTVTARSTRIRAERTARLGLIEQTYQALPIDRRIAIKYGEIAARTNRLQRRPHVIDGLIAATAIVHGVPVYTRDDDYDLIPGVVVVRL